METFKVPTSCGEWLEQIWGSKKHCFRIMSVHIPSLVIRRKDVWHTATFVSVWFNLPLHCGKFQRISWSSIIGPLVAKNNEIISMQEWCDYGRWESHSWWSGQILPCPELSCWQMRSHKNQFPLLFYRDTISVGLVISLKLSGNFSGRGKKMPLRVFFNLQFHSWT